MRRLLAALGVIAVGIGATACTSTASETTSTTTSTTSTTSTTTSTTSATTSSTTLPVSPALTGDRAAVREMKAALRHGGAMLSLHYLSTSVESGLTTTIVGDVNQSSGTQTIVVTYQGSRASMVIELVGHEAYFRGAAMAIELLINLSPRQSAAAAGQWVSVVPADKSYYSNTAAALTVTSVMSEIALSSPVTGSRPVTANGRPALEISGAWTGQGVPARDHATAKLDVTRGPASLPIMFSGLTVSAGNRFTDSLVVSRWGEAVHVVAPRFAVPLSVILKSTTTTTQPIIV